MKGWFDRVFGLGFAFGMNEQRSYGLLTGKRALVVQTAGTSKDFYQQVGASQYPHRGILAGTLGFCGFDADVLTHYGVLSADDAARQHMLADTRAKVLEVLQA
ncbi:MAG: NAD(P)H-dependent oxidoreductase [Myxococcota bacterium]